ncbi:PREDICTED: centrosomal protein of 72 kDa [Elephantulus edwardii]|uniref:centrosomal protein of 72 kDa n=1 Tax=Elephantulus edwardii TaxID=28737 RepID=UPI0003F0BFDD|nr:PREDICTED: centrosomal protein of 72 kDa [Elephantulus edwardii]
MAPVGRLLVLCEEKIRERSGLAAHRDLADLQSLSIPGTYQEKITHLGNSLVKLTGLKFLDLSRNSLVSLEGIQYLTSLERLNLYYNCISSLTEVFRLHCLLDLTDVDFRLNPVVKRESHYRLFVVHMLPNLRQLDDRPVRDSERKASQLHFASEELLDSSCDVPDASEVRRPHHCRAKHADSLPNAAVDVDDEAVLNLIAECEWDLSNPPGSSSRREQGADFPSSQESRCVLSPLLMRYQCGDSAPRGPERKKSGPRGCFPGQQPRGHCLGEEPSTQPAYLQHFVFTSQPGSTDLDVSVTTSPKSSGPTEKTVHPTSLLSEKYRKRRAPGRRFQVPLDQECLDYEAAGGSPHSEDSLARPEGSESTCEKIGPHPEEAEAEELQPPNTSVGRECLDVTCLSLQLCSSLPGKTAALETALLEALLDLVDRHWGGRRSLHSNKTFLAQVRHILSAVQALTAAQEQVTLSGEALGRLALENEVLHQQLAGPPPQHAAQMGEAHLELEAARRETDDLRQRLEKCLEENGSLKSLLSSIEKEAKSVEATTALSMQLAGLQTSVKRLSDEVVQLRQHLEHYDKIQELTRMLQESHGSLVSTNEHLLQELGRTRAQHRAEVEQLRWSYQELKKTMALFPQRRAEPEPGGS